MKVSMLDSWRRAPHFLGFIPLLPLKRQLGMTERPSRRSFIHSPSRRVKKIVHCIVFYALVNSIDKYGKHE